MKYHKELYRRGIALLTVLLSLAVLVACSEQQAAEGPAQPTMEEAEEAAEADNDENDEEEETATAEPSPTATQRPSTTATVTPRPATPTAEPTSTPEPTAEPTPAANLYKGVEQRMTSQGEPMLGTADAPVVLIDYSDFLCAACQRHAQAIEPDIIDQYVESGQVRMIFRPVLNHGERSLSTTEAALCALQQDQFWPMHELLFNRQDEVWNTAEANLSQLMSDYAQELDLDSAAFESCMVEGTALAQAQQWDAEQRTRGITVQPIFEINGQRLVGVQTFGVFQNAIDTALADAS
jgi:protein-disulfide isomerase